MAKNWIGKTGYRFFGINYLFINSLIIRKVFQPHGYGAE